MANRYTEAQARATRKYQEKTVCIQIRVPAEKRDQYKKLAESKGLNLTQLIVQLLEELK